MDCAPVAVAGARGVLSAAAAAEGWDGELEDHSLAAGAGWLGRGVSVACPRDTV